MDKIGLGITAYSRPNYLIKCLESLQLNKYGGANEVVVSIDYKDEETSQQLQSIVSRFGLDYIAHPTNIGVGKSKNSLFKELLSRGCEHIFIMEDDILMKNPNTCTHYISEARRTGVQHMNFAHHGPANASVKPMTFGRSTVYPHCVGAFSYYTKYCLETVGLIDEGFVNAWEHVHHSWRIANNNFTTPFWYFADHPYSQDMLEEIPGSIENSSIRPRDDWGSNIAKGKEYWLQKHGIFLPPFPTGLYQKK
jgi:GT2 family glycosyltransferase